MTDKPAPITVALAQQKKSDTPLLDNNVSIEHLKNLVTDKPAPITVALAQVDSEESWDPNWLAKFAQTSQPHDNETPATITGMKGDEEVYGNARVGGDSVTYENQEVDHITVNGEVISLNQIDKSAS